METVVIHQKDPQAKICSGLLAVDLEREYPSGVAALPKIVGYCYAQTGA